jgi:hypothetical protein
MFCYARNFRIGDQEMSKLLYEGSRATFLEDVDMLEAVQANRDGGSLDGLIDIGTDAAHLQARRFLKKMINTEQSIPSGNGGGLPGDPPGASREQESARI